jgi:tetratricopeptide (TPR) repeat protein
MSPEQATGDKQHVGPGADIHALGAILYKCVTGREPFVTLQETREDEAASPRIYNKGLPRDIEIICLKCLEKEPARRYASAGELADDLRRFLAGQRIRARGPGPIARAVKWRRRHPRLAVALSLLFLSLITGLVVSLFWAREVSRHAEATLKEATRANEAAEQQGWAWNGWARVRRELGHDAEALEAAGKAERIFRVLTDPPRSAATARSGLATALSHKGTLLGLQGKYPEALADLEQAAQLIEQIIEEGPADAALKFRLAQVYNSQANCYMRMIEGVERGKDEDRRRLHEKALERYRQAIRAAAALLEGGPSELRFGDWYARTLCNYALLVFSTEPKKGPGTTEAQLREQERALKAEALRKTEEATAVARGLRKNFPDAPDGRECLAVCLTNLGEIRRELGDRDGALPVLQEAHDLYAGLQEQAPRSFEYRWGVAMAISNLGSVLAAGTPEERKRAAAHYQDADRLYKLLEKENPSNSELRTYARDNRERWDELKREPPPGKR